MLYLNTKVFFKVGSIKASTIIHLEKIFSVCITDQGSILLIAYKPSKIKKENIHNAIKNVQKIRVYSSQKKWILNM